MRGFSRTALGVLISIALIVPAETVLAPLASANAGPACVGWNSVTNPPDYIRVLRNDSNRVDRVPFKKYIVTVMGKEWPSYLPKQVIEAGAVAVKQYGWYHALGRGRISSRGECFDVTDGTGDQLYKPHRSRVRSVHWAALNATWNVRLLKGGQFFMTGYRAGSRRRCGMDATGWKLFARSAVRCAARGMDYEQILKTYYGPNLTILDARYSREGAGLAPSGQQTTASQPNPGSSGSSGSFAQPEGLEPSGSGSGAESAVPSLDISAERSFTLV